MPLRVNTYTLRPSPQIVCIQLRSGLSNYTPQALAVPPTYTFISAFIAVGAARRLDDRQNKVFANPVMREST